MQHRVFHIQHKRYLNKIDELCYEAASKFGSGEPISGLILKYIRALYLAAKAESDFTDDQFEVAYHSPVTGDVEFLFARFLYHFSKYEDLNWKIYLRRQVRKVVPDIRIDSDNQTLAVIEIKSKVGWMQPFFSDDRVASDIKRRQSGVSDFDPLQDIEKTRAQLWKYIHHFNIPPENFFFLVPSLKQAHRKKHKREYDYYKRTFARHAHLEQKNLVVLTNDLRYDASALAEPESVTDEFEDMVHSMIELTRLKT